MNHMLSDSLHTPMKNNSSFAVTPSADSAFKKVESDAFTKITFRVNHPPSRPQVDDVGVCMHVIGSIKALGSWDHARGKRMTRALDGHWELNVYVPTSVEFLYQYVLKDLEDGEVVWESSLERRMRAQESADTSLLHLDDTISPQEDNNNNKRSSKEANINPASSSADDDCANKESATVAPEPMGILAPDPFVAGEWGHSDEDSEDSVRDSILPPPSFACTTLKNHKTPQRRSERLNPGYNDDKEPERNMRTPSATSTLNADAKEFTPNRVQDQPNILEYVSQKITSAVHEHAKWLSPAQKSKDPQGEAMHVLSVRLQEANSQVHTLLEDKAKAEAELQALREAMESLDLGAAKERMDAEEAKRELEQDRQEQQMRSRRFRTALRANEGKFRAAKEGLLSLKIEMAAMQSQCGNTLKQLAEEMSSGIAKITQGTADELEATKRKLVKEVAERKRLHNQVLELRGNIRVFCRVRPLSAREEKEGKKISMLFPSDTELMVSAGGGKYTPYSYDQVFAPTATQEKVYEETRPLITSAMDGYNVCVFAYGQTGSGKTYTMSGLNNRAIGDLFEIAEERKVVAKYEFKVSAIEIYNENLKDLIEPHDDNGKPKKLDVKTDQATGASIVPDAKLEPVECLEDVIRIMERSMRNRSTSCTNMNEHSSRSHLIVTIHMTKCDLVNGGTYFGKMHLIDLAGSERLSRTCAEGDRLTEAKHINKSLSALGNCIAALLSKSKHIPYRDSKLTFLLQDSLGQEAKTLMFVCASSSDADVPETTCSLQFAARVSKVELGAAKKKGDSGAGAILKEADVMRQQAASQMKRAEDEARQALEQAQRSDEERAKAEARIQELEKELRRAAEDRKAKDKEEAQRADQDLLKARARIAELEKELHVRSDKQEREQDQGLADEKRALESREKRLAEMESSLQAREKRLADEKRMLNERGRAVSSSASSAAETLTPSSMCAGETTTVAADEANNNTATAKPERFGYTHKYTDLVSSPLAGKKEAKHALDASNLGADDCTEIDDDKQKQGQSTAALEKENEESNNAAADASSGQSLEERLALFRARKEEARRRQEQNSQAKPKSPLKLAQPRPALASTPGLKRTNALTSGAERVPQRESKIASATQNGGSSIRPKTAPATAGLSKTAATTRPARAGGWR